MKTVLFALAFGIAAVAPASALTADDKSRCSALTKELPQRQKELVALQAETLELAEAAELAGDEWAAVEEQSLLSKEYKAEADALRVVYDEQRAAVADANARLMEKSSAFNADIGWYNQTCASKKK